MDARAPRSQLIRCDLSQRHRPALRLVQARAMSQPASLGFEPAAVVGDVFNSFNDCAPLARSPPARAPATAQLSLPWSSSPPR